jgi:amidohydrolase
MKKTGLWIILCGMLVVYSQGADLMDMIKQQAQVNFQEAVRIRRSLHKIPELCYQEIKTSRFVQQFLSDLGLELHTGIAGTGLKAILYGAADQPVVAIRADMDALPIAEKTGLPYASTHEGIMHACGHDIHMTNVLMAAKILSSLKESVPGTVVFIFQPCEEGAPGGQAAGARRMIQEGILESPKLDAIVGLHNMPDFPVGTVALRSGPLMANVDWIQIGIRGRSSHGAYPHQGVDAVYVASTAVLQFQSLISRFVDPQEPAVLTIGTIEGGLRNNIIAERVRMEGTVRTFSFQTRDTIHEGMRNILKGLETAYGVTTDFKFTEGSRFVKNDPRLSELILPLFKRMMGADRVLISKPVTVGEDFADYSHEIPALFFFLGTGGEGKLHSPGFLPDEKALRYGPMLLAAAAVKILDSLR